MVVSYHSFIYIFIILLITSNMMQHPKKVVGAKSIPTAPKREHTYEFASNKSILNLPATIVCQITKLSKNRNIVVTF